MSAPQRVRCLKAALRTMIHVIARAPATGRPARFVDLRYVQGRVLAASVFEPARRTGLPHVREYIVEQHVVLYAHSDSEVVLLALNLKTSVDRSPPAKPVGHAGPTVGRLRCSSLQGAILPRPRALPYTPPTMPLGCQRAPIN